MMMIANTAGVKKMGGFSWADMLYKKKTFLSDKTL